MILKPPVKQPDIEDGRRPLETVVANLDKVKKKRPGRGSTGILFSPKSARQHLIAS